MSTTHRSLISSGISWIPLRIKDKLGPVAFRTWRGEVLPCPEHSELRENCSSPGPHYCYPLGSCTYAWQDLFDLWIKTGAHTLLANQKHVSIQTYIHTDTAIQQNQTRLYPNRYIGLFPGLAKVIPVKGAKTLPQLVSLCDSDKK